MDEVFGKSKVRDRNADDPGADVDEGVADGAKGSGPACLVAGGAEGGEGLLGVATYLYPMIVSVVSR